MGGQILQERTNVAGEVCSVLFCQPREGALAKGVVSVVEFTRTSVSKTLPEPRAGKVIEATFEDPSTYKAVPLIVRFSWTPVANPRGSVAAPRRPSHTMTSKVEAVVLDALLLSGARNISTHTFALTSAAARPVKSVES